MVALVALLLILAIFGGLGFAVHFLWLVLVAAVLLWLIRLLHRWPAGDRRAPMVRALIAPQHAAVGHINAVNRPSTERDIPISLRRRHGSSSAVEGIE
jgi:energy-coupling factor transporter transmembrane protein EcfT